MLRHAVMGAVLAITLVGCASKPSKEAPIENRGAAELATTPVVAPVATPVVAPPPAVANKGVAAEPAAKKAALEAGHTRPLRADEMQAKPLDAQAAPGSAKAEPVKSAVAVALVRPKARTFLFEYDSAALVAADHAILDQHAAFMKAQPKLEILVQGHADERGSREYNLALGQRRAESVKQALTLLGIPEAHIEAVSLGSEKPSVEGHDESAWKQNRRAVLIYKDE